MPRTTGLLIALVCWWYVIYGSGSPMNAWDMSAVRLPPLAADSAMIKAMPPFHVLPMIVMWWTMMVGMMIPGAIRHIPSSYINGKSPATSVSWFWVGYVGVWFGFSVIASALQFLLSKAGLLHAMYIWSTSNWLSAALLTIAGFYQFSATKKRSLTSCQFFSAPSSPFSGARYGQHCMVSSLPLMLLLFVGGVMNLYWMLALTLMVTLEKTLPNPRWFSLLIGWVCLVTAVWTLAYGVKATGVVL